MITIAAYVVIGLAVLVLLSAASQTHGEGGGFLGFLALLIIGAVAWHLLGGAGLLIALGSLVGLAMLRNIYKYISENWPAGEELTQGKGSTIAGVIFWGFLGVCLLVTILSAIHY